MSPTAPVIGLPQTRDRGLHRDKPREHCGVFGIVTAAQDAVAMTYLGLFALQHRGQESAGIAVPDGSSIRVHKEMGLVSQVFDLDALAALGEGQVALGHTRYSTTGSSSRENAQPMTLTHPKLGPAALAHNGNLINAGRLRQELAGSDVDRHSSSDTQLICALIASTDGDNWPQVLRSALPRLQGAYSLGLVTADLAIGVRDPYGFRPLCLGVLGRAPTQGYVFASESCALEAVGAEHLRDVRPGELVLLGRGEPQGHLFQVSLRQAMCLFELIYFARPDSYLDGCQLYEARVRMGQCLAKEAPMRADMVMALPDSGTPAAIGFAEASGIPFREGLVKSRYVSRTFIQPQQPSREADVGLKLNPLRETIRGKRLVVVDDSIVRGTTSRKIVGMLRRAGAAEIHFRVASPAVRHPCFMGIDIGSSRELVACGRTSEEIRSFLNVDSLHYLSMPGLIRAVGRGTINEFCTACFDGSYPVPVDGGAELGKAAVEV